ncbi:MAG: galactokinase [Defluviitaleaceae bacterium]|nr:galactokinase [Defluviitaleaceae bacterium]
MQIDELKKEFINIFGDGDINIFHAPGRVNIIGEHTDYNGGYVLPTALDMGTYALIRKRGNNQIKFASTNFPEKIEINTSDIQYKKEHTWANYPKGIVHFMQGDGHVITGFDVLFSGNIPNRAGLSSSASIELVMATALNDIFELGYEMIDMVKLAQKAENQFCNVNCGIMDQFIVGMGKEGYGVFLQCNTLKYNHVPLELGDYCIVIMNTNKPRNLVESKYNERRSQCETAVEILQKTLPNINNLTDVSLQDFEKFKHTITDQTIQRRAKHVITENERVLQATKAMEKGDLHKLGELVSASHQSLKNDYAVTGVELDTIVDLALAQKPACIGARMIGAGFGGCAIALVNIADTDRFITNVKQDYTKAIGYTPDFYIAKTGNGAERRPA